ncbi:MAG: T9SS type A sorting domain-containing protein [Salinivirgaceae bacterium]|jgi:hypothetical protein|nr:T9SS type A sorting domain-containing protein [Salinivirgaceae bacterium]
MKSTPFIALVLLFASIELSGQTRYVDVKIEQPGLIECLTSVNQIENKLPEINLYPNPSNGFITIETIGFKHSGELTAIVYNITSVEVFRSVLLFGSKSERTLNLQHLNRGVYMVKVQGGSAEAISRLVIL